jgi:hypothetical protein
MKLSKDILSLRDFERDRKTLLLLELLSQGIAEAEKGKGVDQETFLRQVEKSLALKAHQS